MTLERIIDGFERLPRTRRLRALQLILEAEGAGAFLHARLDEVVDAAQHDDGPRHAADLRESARLLILVAERIDDRRLRVIR